MSRLLDLHLLRRINLRTLGLPPMQDLKQPSVKAVRINVALTLHHC